MLQVQKNEAWAAPSIRTALAVQALLLAPGCGGAPAASGPNTPIDSIAGRPSAVAALPRAADSAAGATGVPLFAKPENAGPRRFRVLGPFPSLAGPDKKGRLGLDHDYLGAICGEARARLDANTSVTLDGKTLTPREVTLDAASTLDLQKLYFTDTDGKTAYAYAEWDVDRPCRALALFGSDDAAAVWHNGKLVHRIVRDRGLIPDSDRFELPLEPGRNRLLVKVDNGNGGWGFALSVLDERGRESLQALDARRNLESFEPVPSGGDYLVELSLPELAWSNPAAAERALAKGTMSVRWFGPNLDAVDRADSDGQYTAVVEARTLDGYLSRQMLAFAKVAPNSIPRFPAPPTREMPEVDIPWRFEPRLNQAQRAELSRHFWRGASKSLRESRDGAIAALALARLGASPPPPDEPLWLSSGFIQVAARELALRLKLEGRKPVALSAPEPLAKPAPELRNGSEAQAGVRSGTVEKIRAAARGWIQADDTPFVALVARRGVVFFHEAYGGFRKDSTFYPASIGKTIAALTFARAVDQGLLGFDQPVGSVLADWNNERTSRLTFRHCFNHISGLTGHASHGGMFNPYLDNALFVEDEAFSRPMAHYLYNGDDVDLTGMALELVTGEPIWRLLYDTMEKPFGEPVNQLDLGFGGAFTAMYLAKVGQMILQDGAYGHSRFFKPGFLALLRPRRIAEFAPELDDPKAEAGIGLAWMPDPPGPRQQGVLGPNVIGHGASSGVTWRIDLDHDVVVVVGRDGYKDSKTNDEWATKLVKVVAEGLLQ